MRIHHSNLRETCLRGVRPACGLGIALVFLALGGCTALQGVRDYVQYNDAMDGVAIGWRNHVWASQAWKDRQHTFADQSQSFDFGEGFRAGYRAIASGEDGCPPPLPPRKYWSWKYSSPEGQAKTAAWFAGYPYGVAAAEEDGAGLWREIQVSEPIAMQYSAEFGGAGCARCGLPGDPGMETIAPPADEQITPLVAPMSQMFNGIPDGRAASSVLTTPASDWPPGLRLAAIKPEMNSNPGSGLPAFLPQVPGPSWPAQPDQGRPTSWPVDSTGGTGASRQEDSRGAPIPPLSRPVRTPSIY